MGANRPPACQNKAYVEIDLKLLHSTGEIRIIGEPIIAPTVTTRIPKGKFEITYTAELFNIMKELGNKKIEVLSFLLDNKDGNNSLNMTNTEIAERTHVSRKTVVETLKILSEADLIRRKGTVVTVSPRFMMKGNQLREAWLMRKYEEIEENKTLPAIEAEIDPQFTFTDNGEIVQHAK